MINAPLIKTEAELSLVLNALRVERERYSKLLVLVTVRQNQERYAALVVEIDALYAALLERKTEADNFNPMDGDRVEIDPCTGHGESW